MKIKTSIEIIDADKAREYLLTVHRQRRVTKDHVRKLARSMSSGHWRMTAEPIQFDSSGHLINGQHRMHAVIESNTSHQFLVVRGLDEQSYEVMDQGRARTRGETLSTLNMKNSSNAAASAAILVRMKFGLEIDRTNVDNAEIMAFAKSNWDALEWSAINAKRCQLLPGSTYGAFLFIAFHANRIKAEAFADAVASGANLAEDSPVLALRKRAEATKGSAQRLEINRTSNLLPILVHAFNKYCQGEPCVKLVLPRDASLYPAMVDEGNFWDDK